MVGITKEWLLSEMPLVGLLTMWGFGLPYPRDSPDIECMHSSSFDPTRMSSSTSIRSCRTGSRCSPPGRRSIKARVRCRSDPSKRSCSASITGRPNLRRQRTRSGSPRFTCELPANGALRLAYAAPKAWRAWHWLQLRTEKDTLLYRHTLSIESNIGSHRNTKA